MILSLLPRPRPGIGIFHWWHNHQNCQTWMFLTFLFLGLACSQNNGATGIQRQCTSWLTKKCWLLMSLIPWNWILDGWRWCPALMTWLTAIKIMTMLFYICRMRRGFAMVRFETFLFRVMRLWKCLTQWEVHENSNGLGGWKWCWPLLLLQIIQQHFVLRA
jgi:hypothetical protein